MPASSVMSNSIRWAGRPGNCPSSKRSVDSSTLGAASTIRWELCLPIAKTRSPTAKSSTPGPTLCIRPTAVYPGGRGVCPSGLKAPRKRPFSLPALTCDRLTRTSTCPGPGSGTSKVSTSTRSAPTTVSLLPGSATVQCERSPPLRFRPSGALRPRGVPAS